MIRILNVEPFGYSEEARARLQGVGELVEREVTRPELLAIVPSFDVIIIRFAHRVDRELLDAAVRLKAICTATTGLDHIDVEHANRNGVAVLSLKGERAFLDTIHATAEHTWALLLALIRRVPQAFNAVVAGEWDRDRFRGRELNGRTLGVVGLGRVGRKVAGFGVAFGMRVAAVDPYCREWMEGVDRAQTLAELLVSSDVVSLHVPLNDETIGLIGDKEIRHIRRGGFLINTSRGEVLREQAAVDALTAGQLAGVAVDVLAGERDGAVTTSPLIGYAREHDTVIVTPHIAGATTESMAKTELFIVEKLRRFLGTFDDPTSQPKPSAIS